MPRAVDQRVERRARRGRPGGPGSAPPPRLPDRGADGVDDVGLRHGCPPQVQCVIRSPSAWPTRSRCQAAVAPRAGQGPGPLEEQVQVVLDRVADGAVALERGPADERAASDAMALAIDTSRPRSARRWPATRRPGARPARRSSSCERGVGQVVLHRLEANRSARRTAAARSRRPTVRSSMRRPDRPAGRRCRARPGRRRARRGRRRRRRRRPVGAASRPVSDGRRRSSAAGRLPPGVVRPPRSPADGRRSTVTRHGRRAAPRRPGRAADAATGRPSPTPSSQSPPRRAAAPPTHAVSTNGWGSAT